MLSVILVPIVSFVVGFIASILTPGFNSSFRSMTFTFFTSGGQSSFNSILKISLSPLSLLLSKYAKLFKGDILYPSS